MVQRGLHAPQPPPYRHGAFGGRPVEADREDERGPRQAQLVEEHMAGRHHAVEEAADQGAALGALLGLQCGALVQVGLGHGPDDGGVRLQQHVHEFDQGRLLAGACHVTQRLPQDVDPQGVRTQQEVQRHALFRALCGPVAEEPVTAGLIRDAAQEEAHSVACGGGYLQVLHVVGEFRVPGQFLERLTGHPAGQFIDPGLAPRREGPGFEGQRHGVSSPGAGPRL
ncbi:hypothetical protein [Streptomyces rectiviolaceus]|uniref:hypothetical protein n=1 Tax=Streptomyces rectiviolaceus TaxID=332591 RepID=UPI0031E1B17A